LQQVSLTVSDAAVANSPDSSSGAAAFSVSDSPSQRSTTVGYTLRHPPLFLSSSDSLVYHQISSEPTQTISPTL